MNADRTELNRLLAAAANHVMTPAEMQEQRRSFARGMCPFDADYAEWCRRIDELMPPLEREKR